MHLVATAGKRPSLKPARWVTALTVALSLGLPGCNASCDRTPGDPPVRHTGGTTLSGTYESSPPEGPFLDFPAGRTYRFVHGLGVAPRVWSAEFASEKFPSGVALGAGNQATKEAVTAEYMDVRNDTCSDVWLRVTAQGEPLPPGGEGLADGGTRDR